jgi:hypothetical protein
MKLFAAIVFVLINDVASWSFMTMKSGTCIWERIDLIFVDSVRDPKSRCRHMSNVFLLENVH